MPATSPPGRKCPNCFTVVHEGRTRCPSCKMEVAAMDAFAAARQAAEQRGKTRTDIGDSGPAFWRTPKFIAAIIFLALIAGSVYYFTRPGPPPWLKFPTAREEVVRQLFTDISTDDNAGADKAYALIAPPARDPSLNDEQGLYRQLFHNVYAYLSGELGADCWTRLQVQPDPKDPDVLLAKFDIETLHVRIAPTSWPQGSDATRHYSLVGIDEFNILKAADMQKYAIVGDVFSNIAGPAAGNNLQTIIGVSNPPHETPFERKVRLLPVLRNPRAISRRAILQVWPVREDPVVKRRLEMIQTDGRYEKDVQDTATQILKGTVDETDLIAAGVDK